MYRIFLFVSVTIICVNAYNKQDTLFFPYGLAQYSFRWDYFFAKDVNRRNCSLEEYTNKIGIYYGFLIKINKSLSFQFQFGNDRSVTNKVNCPFSNSVTVLDKSYLPFYFPCFHLAYLQLKLSFWSLETGKISLTSFGPLDLIERSMASDNFQGAALIGWSDATSNSLFGAKTSIHIFNNLLSVEFFTTIIETKDKKDFLNNLDSSVFLFVLNVPLKGKHFSFVPQLAITCNRNLNCFTRNSDNEWGLGFSSNYQLNKNIEFKLMCAWARLSKYDSKYPVDSLQSISNATFRRDYRGLELGLGTTVKSGAVLVEIDTKYSKSLIKKSKESISNYFYGELKYILKPHTKFSIIPRFRFYSAFCPNHQNSGNFLFCPELIFCGHF